MVKFSEDDRSFVVTFKGCKEDYLNMKHALLRLMTTQDVNFRDSNNETNYYAGRILEDMMPDAEQKITVE